MDDHTQALLNIGNCQELIEFATTPARAFVLLANLQLALRHPGNTSESAAIVREMAAALEDAICSKIPEARTLIRQGWDPAYDVTREYFNEEFPLLLDVDFEDQMEGDR